MDDVGARLIIQRGPYVTTVRRLAPLVPPERVRPSYFRKWAWGQARSRAIMDRRNPQNVAYLGKIPRYMIGAAVRHMPALAEAQEEGQWTIFWVALLVGLIGFFTVITELGLLKGDSGEWRILRIALVAATLASSWLFTHVVFALRYAHEWYDTDSESKLRRGLDFPGDNEPDYMDFLYFSLVLGMTFQVSDVQIKASRLRRLATLHGLVSFLYNTVILALSVNIAAGLL